MQRKKLKEKVFQLQDTHFEEVVRIRRHLHAHPELSYEEEETGRYISGVLSRWGVDHTTGWGGNGIVALLGKKKSGPVVGLRADMDALPIQEENDVPYKSTHPGIMHACGHDVHTSSLLGTIRILKELEGLIEGRVKCIFQPGEEKLPGGASILIGEGVLDNPAPGRMLGQHVHPPLEAGKIGFKAGQYMASADEIYITIRGRGGHAALPQDCIDPITVMAHVITSLQQMVSRNADPMMPTVLSIGKVNTVGGATNIIPSEVKLEGTFRTFDEAWRADAHQKMKTLVEGICASMGATCEFNLMKGYPFLYNDPDYTTFCFEEAIQFLGANHVVELPMRTTAEDFAYFSHEVPSCFYRLGTGNPARGITSPVHTPTFDIDEEALRTSMGLMASLTLRTLQHIR